MMKKCLIIVALTVLWFNAAMGQGKISVTVEGLRNTTGTVFVTLQNSAEMFKADSKYIKVATIDIAKGKRSCTLDNVPAGTYALSVLHDEDGNQKVTTNLVGMPKEGFGFSNNPTVKMRKPSFDAVSFKVESGKTAEQKIKMIYL